MHTSQKTPHLHPSSSHHPEPVAAAGERGPKKPFTAPRLERHPALPTVTAGSLTLA